MRLHPATCFLALVVAACAQTVDVSSPAVDEREAEPVTYYGDDWYLSEFWPGEWPDGFVVTDNNVKLQGRTKMSPQAPTSVTCPVPQYANYNPWNHERVASDELNFVSAQKISKITILEDVELEAEFSGPAKALSLKTGDELLFKSYYAEGYFLASFNGEDYELHYGQLDGIAEFEDDSPLHEWIQVTCDNPEKTRAWLLLSEVKRTSGIGPVVHDDFGMASDVTPSNLP